MTPSRLAAILGLRAAHVGDWRVLVGGHAGALLGFRFAVFPDRSPSLDAASLGRQARGRCARRASNVRSRQWVPVLWARDAGAGVPRQRPHAGAGHLRLRCRRRGRSLAAAALARLEPGLQEQARTPSRASPSSSTWPRARVACWLWCQRPHGHPRYSAHEALAFVAASIGIKCWGGRRGWWAELFRGERRADAPVRVQRRDAQGHHDVIARALLWPRHGRALRRSTRQASRCPYLRSAPAPYLLCWITSWNCPKINSCMFTCCLILLCKYSILDFTYLSLCFSNCDYEILWSD